MGKGPRLLLAIRPACWARAETRWTTLWRPDRQLLAIGHFPRACRAAPTAAPPANPLLVQRLDYAALRPDARTAGLFTASNGRLPDVPGRPQSPCPPPLLPAAGRAWSPA